MLPLAAVRNNSAIHGATVALTKLTRRVEIIFNSFVALTCTFYTSEGHRKDTIIVSECINLLTRSDYFHQLFYNGIRVYLCSGTVCEANVCSCTVVD